MFELCKECRRAYNFSGDLDETSEEPSRPRDVQNEAETSTDQQNVENDVSEESRDDGTEGTPVRKRVRVEEMSSVAKEMVECGEDLRVCVKEGESSEGVGVGGRECEAAAGEEGGQESEGEGSEASREGLMVSEASSPEDENGEEQKEEGTPVERGGERGHLTTPVCSACLGLLYEDFIDSLASDVSTELEKADYEHLSSFSLSLSTPLSLMIRQCAVAFYLRENFKITDELAEPRDGYVKETLRHKLYMKLKSKLSPLTSDVESPFQIVIKLDHSRSDMEYQLAAKTWPDAFTDPRRKRRKWRYKKSKSKPVPEQGNSPFNTASIVRALSGATAADFDKSDFLSACQLCTYSVDFLHSPLFVGGRYCKYSRELPQTPWVIDGVRKAETSVQELICDQIQSLVRASQIRFSSSGREDCDVRMLGDGRPFLVELVNPRKTKLNTAEVEAVQLEINSGSNLVEVKRLRVMVKADAVQLKEGEAEKKKVYRALVWAPQGVTQADLDKLAGMEDTVIHQKTPIRVLHRRALATRDRTIHCMQAELVKSDRFYLNLTTQAGTYIKEFVHGDFGRTQPNLRMILGQDVDIMTLDVCNVLLDWPPPLDD